MNVQMLWRLPNAEMPTEIGNESLFHCIHRHWASESVPVQGTSTGPFSGSRHGGGLFHGGLDPVEGIFVEERRPDQETGLES